MMSDKIKVLIADDELHIRLMLKTAMTSSSTEVIADAKNGEDAVKLFRLHKPHIALLDINMPVKTGIDALKEIKNEFPDAFVIMLTSLSDADTIEDCLEAGAASYILKDTPLTEMKKLVQEAWDDFRTNKE